MLENPESKAWYGIGQLPRNSMTTLRKHIRLLSASVLVMTR